MAMAAAAVFVVTMLRNGSDHDAAISAADCIHKEIPVEGEVGVRLGVIFL